MSDRTSTDSTIGKNRPRRRRTGWRRLAEAVALASLVAVFFLLGGFIWFAGHATDTTGRAAIASADGIVVFTGGKDRIAVAASLLAQGKGRRLLISGVNPATPRRDLEGLTPEMQRLSQCCIDLGRQAEDTIGNARETAEWASGYGFKSLLVVTSAYHLPRSLSELSSAMPDAILTGVPVVSAHLVRPWWRDRVAIRLLVAEYGKYLASQARLAVMPAAKLAASGG